MEVRVRSTTGWGTEGFSSETARAEYGEIKKGDLLGGFRVEDMVGAGAMAIVYRANQISLDRSVALKILPKAFATRASFVRQFDSETELLASLNHPNIVSIIDRGREGETYYFAMEFVEGTTFGELIASGELDEEFFLQILEQCCDALTYAHSKGVVHRDLKPANIMLNENGMVKIADFGVAGLIASADEAKSGKKKVMGTRGYMPPEQEIHVNRTDERSDVFSLGAVMYRALVGIVPDRLPPTPPSKANPRVDPRLDRIVLTCLAAKPQQRYRSARDLLDAVRAYRQDLARAYEICPECKKESPPTAKVCVHCGADLSALFDSCPECGADNRIDRDICTSCGVNLSEMRRQTSMEIGRIEERARRLAGRHNYDGAIAALEEVLQTKEKMFQRARERARRFINNYRKEERAYYRDQIAEGKRLAAEGHLADVVPVLEAVPEAFGLVEDVEALLINVKSRMALSRQRVAGTYDLIKQQRYADAEKALNNVAQSWVDCPGLEDARAQLHDARETDKMVEFELREVRRFLDEGKTTEARRALEFATATRKDHPLVRDLRAEIDRQSGRAILKSALTEGRKAFDDGRFRDAIGYLSAALELIPDTDANRTKISDLLARAQHEVDKVEAAKRDAQERAAELAAMRAARGPWYRQPLVLALIGVLVAIFGLGGVIVWLSMAE
jgi:serine/threonine protein kinase